MIPHRRSFLAVVAALPSLISGGVVEAKDKVVCFGDSITKRGYPAIVGESLGVEVVNAGVAGNSTAQALRRMKKDVLDHRPDVVVLFFGTNDMRVDAPRVYVTVDDYGKNLERMVVECTKGGARVVICTAPPIRSDTYFTRHEKADFEKLGGLEKMLADYRAAAMKVAAGHKLPVVDLNQLLKDEKTWMHRDGVHPSPDGNAIIAGHVARAVAPLVRGESQPSER